MTVLFVGVIAFTVLSSYLILSVTALQSSRSVELSTQSLANAHACIERALLELQEDINYAGDETLTLESGTCTLLEVGGSGTQNRTVCATGAIDNSTRKMEVVIDTVLPSLVISYWREASTFTYCTP